MKPELLTNTTVVDDTIKFVDEKSFDQWDTKVNIRDNERQEEDEIQESLTTNSIFWYYFLLLILQEFDIVIYTG